MNVESLIRLEQQTGFSSKKYFADHKPLSIDDISDTMQFQDHFNPSSGTENLVSGDSSRLEESHLLEDASLSDYVTYFDTYWKEIGLPADWYSFNRIGFSMKKQMTLLKGESLEEVTEWAQQTKLDMIGFGLEYLSRELVYPAKYTIVDGQLIDIAYGKDIEDLTSSKERGGAVSRAVQEVKDIMNVASRQEDENPGGKGEARLLMIPSGMGDTGLHMDNGTPIRYPDSHFYVFYKAPNSKEVMNFSVKTDFKEKEVRNVVTALTGQVVPEDASMTDLLRVITTGDDFKSPADIVTVLEEVRAKDLWRKGLAFKQEGWDKVYQGIEKGDNLYETGQRERKRLEDFELEATSGKHPKLGLQKLIAAHLVLTAKERLGIQKSQSKLHLPGFAKIADTQSESTYGDIYTMMEALEGCEGGGAITVVESIAFRIGVLEGGPIVGGSENKQWCNSCPKCNYKGSTGVGFFAKKENGFIYCPMGCFEIYKC